MGFVLIGVLGKTLHCYGVLEDSTGISRRTETEFREWQYFRGIRMGTWHCRLAELHKGILYRVGAIFRKGGVSGGCLRPPTVHILSRHTSPILHPLSPEPLLVSDAGNDSTPRRSLNTLFLIPEYPPHLSLTSPLSEARRFPWCARS